METEWLPIEGNVTALIPLLLTGASVSRSEPHVVRGRDEHGRLARVALAWLDEESKRRALEALEEAEGGSEGPEGDYPGD